MGYKIELPLDSKVRNVSIFGFVIKCFTWTVLIVGAFQIPPLFGTVNRGLFCNDESIHYDYRPNTISLIQKMIYNISITISIIFSIETWRFYKVKSFRESTNYQWKNYNIHKILVQFWKYFEICTIGYFVTVACNISTKHMVGRLRPNFWEVCKPINGTCSFEEPYKYIADIECTGDPNAVEDARKSFYSGHSAVCFYIAVWLALYIQARIFKHLNNHIFVPVLQTFLLLVASAIGFSRLYDNKHHWSDILVGSIAGTITAIITCCCWSDLFQNRINKQTATNVQTAESSTTLGTDLSRESSVNDRISIRTSSTYIKNN
ncbi:unnamed protein product [Caenorhabditis angaria]|uniref:Phosphatidic acid phosphatase type 2/haloperoxidase domain-containing protein n=1 Tax=Caenorhabditis angaria TaxID=860376 RepID=A0A9P1MVZ5_9PELO|nr:unnamed protein product [Caenorhabditis angaria]